MEWFNDWVSPEKIVNATYRYETRKWEAVIWRYGHQEDVWYTVLFSPKVVGMVTPIFTVQPLAGFPGLKLAQEAVENVVDAFPTGGSHACAIVVVRS